MCACVIVEMDRYNIRLSKTDSRPSSRGSCYEWVSNWNYVQPATVQERLQWDFVVISLSCILCWAKYSLLCGACAECARDDDDEAGEFPTIHFALSIGIIIDIVGGWVHQAGGLVLVHSLLLLFNCDWMSRCQRQRSQFNWLYKQFGRNEHGNSNNNNKKQINKCMQVECIYLVCPWLAGLWRGSERARAPNGLSMMMQRNIFTGPAINDNARDTG